MSRYATMTMGFLLVFMGIKFLMVESYYLTPQATKFWLERIEDPASSEAFGQPNNSTNGANTYANNYGAYNNHPNNAYSNGYSNNYSSPYRSNNNGFGNPSPFQAASYQRPYAPQNMQVTGASGPTNWLQKQLTPPRWVGWPMLFLGAVLVLQGASLRRS